jgi:uncharacterized membrane protein HdeD (DUF308 family)
LFAVVLFILYLLRKKIFGYWDGLKGKFKIVAKWFSKHQENIKRYAQSIMTPFVLIGLVLLFWPFSGFLAMVMMFLFWISAVFQIVHFRRKRIQQKPKPAAILGKDSVKRCKQ